MKRVKRLFFAIGGLAGGAFFFVANASVTAAVIAATGRLGYWAYPTFFGVNVFLVASAFFLHGLLHAWFPEASGPSPGSTLGRFTAWCRSRLTVESRLQKGPLSWIRKRGPFFLVLCCSFFPGPFFAGLVIKFLRLPAQKAWTYAIVTTLITTAISISAYLGLLDGLRAILAAVFPG